MSETNGNRALAGRRAFVTGAAQGLGEAIARALHEAGARVAVTDVDVAGAEAVAAGLGEGAFALSCDVRERASLAAAAERTIDAFGGIDILVNNAAVTVRRPFFEISQEEWDDVIDVNLRGVFFGCQVIGEHLRDAGWGRIVNLSSISGQSPGGIASAHYGASKAGIMLVTKVAAYELAAAGVTVNTIAPAAIDGPVMRALPDEIRNGYGTRIPGGRIGTPEEVGALTVFLCSDLAGYITGATYDINGGLLMR
ncbi:MAG: SDR family oxidoreductase [Solirubrobacterales bacterium]